MTKTQIMLYILVCGILIFGVSSFMEFYKKVIRRNKSSIWEIRIVAGVVTLIPLISLKMGGIFRPILNIEFGSNIYFDYVIHYILFYYVQLQANMKLIKSLIRACIFNILENYGFKKEQIDEMLKDNNSSKE